MNNVKLRNFIYMLKDRRLSITFDLHDNFFKSFLGNEKSMKATVFNHSSENENKWFPKLKLIKKLHYFFSVFKSLYLINVGYNACQAVCLKRQSNSQ